MLKRSGSYKGTKRSKTSTAIGGLGAIAAGAKIQRAWRAYRSHKFARRMVARQLSGKGTVMPFHRTVYSNYAMASGNNRQAIYLQTGISPFRILNTGSGNFVNADQFSMFFTATNMNINWYEGATLQDVYTYNLPEMTELFRLYDQMQIDWVELEWFYGNNSADYQGATSTAPPGDPTRTIFGHPMLLYCKDYNDAYQLGTNPITYMAQYENHKAWQMGVMPESTKHIIRVKPKFTQQATGDGGAITGVIQSTDSRKLWLDTTDGQAIPHYGIKGCINLVSSVQATTPQNTYLLGVLGFRCTVHFKFKNVK